MHWKKDNKTCVDRSTLTMEVYGVIHWTWLLPTHIFVFIIFITLSFIYLLFMYNILFNMNISFIHKISNSTKATLYVCFFVMVDTSHWLLYSDLIMFIYFFIPNTVFNCHRNLFPSLGQFLYVSLLRCFPHGSYWRGLRDVSLWGLFHLQSACCKTRATNTHVKIKVNMILCFVVPL